MQKAKNGFVAADGPSAARPRQRPASSTASGKRRRVVIGQIRFSIRQIHVQLFVFADQLIHRQATVAGGGFAAEHAGEHAIDGAAHGFVLMAVLRHLLVKGGDVSDDASVIKISTSWLNASSPVRRVALPQ